MSRFDGYFATGNTNGVLHWGLQPLRTVSVELAVIESGQRENLKGNYPRELRPLTDSINSLINHEHKQQKRYRNGLANLAHTLKTPLAVLKGAVNGEGDEQFKRKIIHEQINRMENISNISYAESQLLEARLE